MQWKCVTLRFICTYQHLFLHRFSFLMLVGVVGGFAIVVPFMIPYILLEKTPEMTYITAAQSSFKLSAQSMGNVFAEKPTSPISTSFFFAQVLLVFFLTTLQTVSYKSRNLWFNITPLSRCWNSRDLCFLRSLQQINLACAGAMTASSRLLMASLLSTSGFASNLMELPSSCRSSRCCWCA